MDTTCLPTVMNPFCEDKEFSKIIFLSNKERKGSVFNRCLVAIQSISGARLVFLALKVSLRLLSKNRNNH